jgi:hypothetical protein
MSDRCFEGYLISSLFALDSRSYVFAYAWLFVVVAAASLIPLAQILGPDDTSVVSGERITAVICLAKRIFPSQEGTYAYG